MSIQLLTLIVIGSVTSGYIFGWLDSAREKRRTITSAISDLERLNEVLSAGIADQVRIREIIEKLKGAVE